MEVTIVELLMSYGLPGAVIAALGWFIMYQSKKMHEIQDETKKHYTELLQQSNMREEAQHKHINEQQKELSKLSALLEMISCDLRDIRRKVGIKKDD